MVSRGLNTIPEEVPRLQQLPARPRLADIVAAISREFGVAGRPSFTTGVTLQRA